MKQGVIEEYEDNQLAVAIADLAEVRRALGSITVASEEPDERLGLALVTLADVEAAARKLRADDSGLAARMTEARRITGSPAAIEPTDLDLVIFWLRDHFRSAYDGYLPTIGKNRVIEPVRGLPYIGGGGEGDPHFGGFGDPQDSSGGIDGTVTAAPPPGWPRQRGTKPGHDVRVGVLDTQLYQHEWFAGGYDAAEKDLLPLPVAGRPALPASAGHATFIAGLILRRAPGAQLDIRPVLDKNAVGKAWDVAKRMADFIGSGVDILNLSFGCFTDDGQPPLVLARAVSLLSAEILLVAAAGNHGNIDELKKEGAVKGSWADGLTPKTPLWPAAFDQVVAVGATDAPFSPRVPWVGLTAPGMDVVSTYLTGEVKLDTPGAPPTRTFSNGFAQWSGTSFAAASVSGAVAARVRPGHDARRALADIRKEPPDDIRPCR